MYLLKYLNTTYFTSLNHIKLKVGCIADFILILSIVGTIKLYKSIQYLPEKVLVFFFFLREAKLFKRIFNTYQYEYQTKQISKLLPTDRIIILLDFVTT